MKLTRLASSSEGNRQAPFQTEPILTPEGEEILHLKRLLVTLKQHYEKGLHQAQLQLQVAQNQYAASEKELEKVQVQLIENQESYEEEIEALRDQQLTLKESLKEAEDQLQQLRHQPSSSQELRRELEGIKYTLAQGTEETKALESRYIDILQAKIALEHQYKQLQLKLEHQSSDLTSFQERLYQLEDDKKVLASSLQAKEIECEESDRERQAFKQRLASLNKLAKEKEQIQEKYEHLKEEWGQLSERLEESMNIRAQAESYLIQLETIAASQEVQLQESAQQLQALHQEKDALEFERDQHQTSLEESERRLKVAQQHLAKKVKEVAVLNQTLEEQQLHLSACAKTIDEQKTWLMQLQERIELSQREEKRLQEELHEALKGIENQVAKWEEKYFLMYDKWQESENQIRELKKFEEKHLQMQHLLANLGSFMGGTFNPLTALFHSGQEAGERPLSSFPSEPLLTEDSSSSDPKTEPSVEKYDLFGMKQPSDKYNPHLFS